MTSADDPPQGSGSIEPGAPEPKSGRRILLASLGFAALCAGFMLIRVLGYGELWLPRTFWLTGMSAVSGFSSAVLTLAALQWIASGWPRVSRSIAAGLGFAGGYVLSFALLFVFHNRVIAGQYEPHPDHPIRSMIFSSLETGGLFLYSFPRYALPWMLPLLMLAAAIVLPRILPQRRG